MMTIMSESLDVGSPYRMRDVYGCLASLRGQIVVIQRMQQRERPSMGRADGGLRRRLGQLSPHITSEAEGALHKIANGAEAIGANTAIA